MPLVKIPPRGTSNVGIEVTRVAHGFDMRVEIRTLGSQRQDELPPGVYPYLALWNRVSQYLRSRGFDLVEELSWVPPLKRKDSNNDGKDD